MYTNTETTQTQTKQSNNTIIEFRSLSCFFSNCGRGTWLPTVAYLGLILKVNTVRIWDHGPMGLWSHGPMGTLTGIVRL